MKKALAIILTLVLMLSVLPFGLFTITASAATSGYYTYEVSNGEATITGVSTSISGRVTIPSKLGGYPVTSIGYRAFYGCDGLTSITIPDSVTSIGYRAFESCTSLTSITIPDSVTSIGSYAFYNTAYYNNSTNWENDVLYLGKHLINANTSISGAYKIKDGTLTIAGSAFSDCTSLTSITIPDSVTSIGGGAFEYCSSLTSITIPDSVTSIGNFAFSYCTSLTSITIPDNVTSIGGGAFEYCSSLTSITIPDSVTSIGEYAFEDCSSLTSITIPDSVTSIGYSAFKNCSSLTSITIPDSVTSIGDRAFSDCTSLTSITIPDSVTSIGDRAFSDCTSLTSITIPDSVTSIGEDAFYKCTSLTSITIPDSVTSIGNFAFYYCTSLTSITIPDSVTSIGGGAFEYCSSLTSITIPDSVTSIGNYAFYYCTSLTSITIPDSVTSIGNFAFSYCTSLTSITIPDSVTSIGSSAFSYCSSLSSITIPDSVTSIGNYAFYNCSSLKTVNYCGTKSQWENISVGSDNGPLLKANIVYNYIIRPATPKAPTLAYEGNGMVVLDSVDGLEYSLDKENWQSSNIFKGLLPSTTYTFYCRVAETEDLLASKISEGLTITTSQFYYKPATPNAPTVQNVTDTTVTLVAVDGHEYSLDGVTWQDSNIFTGLSPVTQYNFYCRVKATATIVESNKSSALTVTTTKSTPAKPSAPTLDNVTVTEIKLVETEDYEYSIDGVNWQTSGVFGGLNPNTTYSFYCRVAETATSFASVASNSLKVTTPKYSATTPDAPEIEMVTATSVTLVAVEDCEYSKNGTTWQLSNVFEGLSPNREYSFYCRLAETDTTYASEKSLATVVTTLKHTVSAPSKPKLAYEGEGMVILNTSSGCEYSFDGINWQSSNIFEGLRPNKTYTFYCRIPETDTAYAAVSEGLTITTSNFAFIPDTNKDGVFSAADAVYLMNHAIFGNADYPVNMDCDFNNDGVVTEDDAVYLLYHVLFGEEYPLS